MLFTLYFGFDLNLNTHKCSLFSSVGSNFFFTLILETIVLVSIFGTFDIYFFDAIDIYFNLIHFSFVKTISQQNNHNNKHYYLVP